MNPHVVSLFSLLSLLLSHYGSTMTSSALDLMGVPSIATEVHEDEGVRGGMKERK
jgi:hypothetical protein